MAMGSLLDNIYTQTFFCFFFSFFPSLRYIIDRFPPPRVEPIMGLRVGRQSSGGCSVPDGMVPVPVPVRNSW